MSIVNAIENKTKALSPLAELINNKCSAIGGVYHLDYGQAVVLTDDFRKHAAGGVPLGGYLLAAAGKQTDVGFVLDDEELILLRVRGTASLPNESELVQTRLAVVRDATTSGRSFDDVTDNLTRDELQQSAFDCEVIGTFYANDVAGEPLEFGADIDNVVSSAKYQVFLPSTDVLSWLASYPEAAPENTLPLGTVRFSSTRRRARLSGTSAAEVRVHVTDFISRKTAVFGMTRTGKSNTIKTIVTAVFQHGVQQKKRIGQLIFDPQGEYANVNEQDGTGLRLLGNTADEVRVYKERPDASVPIEQPLRINFLDAASLQTVWEMVQQEIAVSGSANTQYMAGFRSVNMEEPPTTEISALQHFERYRLAFYALLHRSGVTGTLAQTRISLTNALGAELVGAGIAGVSGSGMSVWYTSSGGAAEVLKWLRAKDEAGALTSSWHTDFDGGQLGDIIKAMEGRASDAAIKRLKPFHDPAAVGEIGELIWQDMQVGRLVIVDLSQGNGSVVKTLSERIVTTLLNRARDVFSDGKASRAFQIVVEEAHNLFERGARDTDADPWVRLSKEAAKYKIGMMYATQEVSSVDKRVLSNTSNWLVAHLNSDNETRELSHYYDFKTWETSLRRCEDIGFVRMKTYSGKYIVPVQIAKFDHDMINRARVIAGLAPIDEKTP